MIVSFSKTSQRISTGNLSSKSSERRMGFVLGCLSEGELVSAKGSGGSAPSKSTVSPTAQRGQSHGSVRILIVMGYWWTEQKWDSPPVLAPS